MVIPGQDAEKDGIGVLQSDTIPPGNATEIAFWYIMSGFGSGNLSLDAIIGNRSVELWRKTGRQGKGWIFQTWLQVPEGTERLEFRATVRIPVGSDVAIDDINMKSDPSNIILDNAHCAVTTTSKSTATTSVITSTEPLSNKTKKVSQFTMYRTTSGSPCMKIADVGNILTGSCSFENGTCGIKIIPNDTHPSTTWEVKQGRDGTEYDTDVILGDHTFNDTSEGHYIHFLNGRGFGAFNNQKEIASLETPAIYADYTCLSFWYNTPAKYSNLKVLIREYTGQLRGIWSVDNVAGQSPTLGWQKQMFSLIEDPPFTIVFQVFANYHLARAGIDDITIIGVNGTIDVTKAASISRADVTKTLLPSSHTSVVPNKPESTSRASNASISTLAFKFSTGKDASKPPVTQMSAKMSSQSKIQDTQKSTTPQEKERTTKATPANTKKPPVKSEEQSASEDHEKTSVIIGSVVGGVLAVIFVALLVYSFIHCIKTNNRLKTPRPSHNGKPHSNNEKGLFKGYVNNPNPHFTIRGGNEGKLSTEMKFERNGVKGQLKHSTFGEENTRF